MAAVRGVFEIHLTVSWTDFDLAAFAGRHGLKYTEIVLDRGEHPVQPMLSVAGRGSLDDQHLLARRWADALRAEGRVSVQRTKIETAPWSAGVPQTDAEAAREPDGRYFEHHVKLLLPDAGVERLVALTELVVPHGARLSRNARRRRTDGAEERFVTQRCHGVGRPVARQRLDALLTAINVAGHEVLETEEEYVVFDSAIRFDEGWLEPRHVNESYEDRMRVAPAGAADYPSTYRPVPATPDVRQRAAFDPAMRQFRNAYRAGEPAFADPVTGAAWRAARWAAMRHVLSLIAAAPWARHLVLRGSVPLRAWLGTAAREPGDLDFVVVPRTVQPSDPISLDIFDGLVRAVAGSPEAGLRADDVAVEDIWTYERVPGRRLVFPFAVDGLPPGSVQLDLVFNEELPLPPVPLTLPGVASPMLTAPPALALAWKLLWLETDKFPQGKDLYDAALLAEFTSVDRTLIREVLRPEFGAAADLFTAESVLAWVVDWQNFRDEYPDITGDADAWQHRLALALNRSIG